MHGEDEAELAALLDAALDGDERAYAEFLRRAATLVRRMVRQRTNRGGPEPEDIVQETLLAVHLKRHTWKRDAAVGPWLHAIARYKMIDAFRRKGRSLEVPVGDDFDPPAQEPEERASEREIDKALAALPPREHAVVSAISVEGRSISQTAVSLHMSEGAVRVALHRGLARISRIFGRE